ncbi:MAG: OsmC family peroxiredoxin [Burkholderiales bacterium]|nr:MAG: OsmC family peroxiredoxin [Burkholderiales bacterium]
MPHLYTAETIWHRADQPFTDQRYSRGHLLRFDGGVDVPGSSSPHSVPLPMSVEAAVDPEEALVSAVSSCHMLWFLSLACDRGFIVDDYHDQAEGVMRRNEQGKLAITLVTLRPRVVFSGPSIPNEQTIAELHHEAHEACFIANSIRSEVKVEPRA